MYLVYLMDSEIAVTLFSKLLLVYVVLARLILIQVIYDVSIYQLVTDV